MLRRQVRVSHRHGQGAVAENFLQHQDVSTVGHEMAGERMPQDMRELASGKRQAGFVYRVPECTIAAPEKPLGDGSIIAVPLFKMCI